MDNVLNLEEKQQEYRENVRRLNKNSLIIKAKQAQILLNEIVDILTDPEDK